MAKEFIYTRHILDEGTFERLRDLNEDYQLLTYEEFYDWNNKCYNELSSDDKTWLQVLIKRIRKGQIKQVDLEDCGEWESEAVYFDLMSNICIMHPR